MEPEDALELARRYAGERDPLTFFTELGGSMMSDEEPSSAFELGCSAFPSAREPERTGAPGAAVPGGHHYAAAGKCVAPRHCAAPYI